MPIERPFPIRFAVLLVLLGLHLGTRAQNLRVALPEEVSPLTEPQPLTLQEAVEISFRQNPIIEAERLARESAVDQQKAAWGLRLPRLDVAGTYAYLSEDIKALDLNPEKDALLGYLGQLQLPIPIPGQVIQAIQGLDLSLTLQKRQFAAVGAVVTAPIYTGGKINAAVNAARIKVELQDVEAEKARVDLFTEVVERYYGLALAQRVTEVLTQVTEGMRKHLYDAQRLEENGIIARTEKLYAEMFLAKAEGEEEAARLEVRTVNRALGTSLDRQSEYLPISAFFIVDELPSLAYFQEKPSKTAPFSRVWS